MIYIHSYDLKNNTLNARQILLNNIANYLRTDISTIKISYNENGKPYVEGLYFSISHSKNILVQTFSKTNELGLDVEFINPKRKIFNLAKRYFHQQEYHYIKSLPTDQGVNIFYQLWTHKEAVCKAKGGRLWFYLADNYINNNNQISTYLKGMHLHQIFKFNDYACTLATKSKVDKVKYINV